MNEKPVSYLQTNPKWKSLPYRTSKETATIGGSGCGPTAMAMVIATWVDPSVTPVETCKWSVDHGYKATGNGTYHSYFVPQAKAYGLVCERINTEAIKYLYPKDANAIHQKAHDYIDEGHLVICLMGKGNWTSGGHYILWYDNDGDDVLINDPASTKAHRVRNTFELLKSEVRFYWVIKRPEEEFDMTKNDVIVLIKEEVSKLLGATLGDTPSDYAKESWEKAKSLGITDGTNPKNDMTREGVITILDRLGLIDKKAIDLINELIEEDKKSEMGSEPSKWATETWEKAKSLGITDGTNPKRPLTREQAMVLLDRVGMLKLSEPIGMVVDPAVEVAE